MPRVKRGKTHLKRRKNILARTKGMMWGRTSKLKLAKTAAAKAGAYAYRDRRVKKREFRALWQMRINAAAREHGISYAALMGKIKKANIALDRKVLATLAVDHPAVFAAVLKKATT